MKKLLSTSILTIFCVISLNSQDIYNLTLEQSIEIAKAKSLSILRLGQDTKIAKYNLNSATSKLKTHINLDINTPKYSEEIRSFEDSTGVSYFPVKQLKYEANLVITQPLPTDGNIYIQNYASTLNDMRKKARYTNLRTRVGLSQPLDALYGYNGLKSTLKRAKLGYEQSNKALKREELNLIYLVSSGYYNLLSLQKKSEIALLDLERQTEAYEISKNKFAAGLIREVDALQMEVDLAEAQNNYDIAILNEESVRNSFKELLGINLNDSINISNELKYNVVIINPDIAINLALKNRLEIKEQEIQIQLQKINIKQQKTQGMIRGSIEAHFEKEGINPQLEGGNYTSFNKSLDNSWQDYKDRPVNYSVGLKISVPILDWGENRAMVKAAEARLTQINYRKEEIEREIETEVRNLVANTNSNLKRLQLLEKNVVVAEKSFEITRQRYSDGDIDSQALALERSRLNNAYTSHLQAYINYQLSLADLMRKTFYDFRTQQEIE
ncbi:TolC family protein [Dysgonomonas sp. 216]|uniref:TolC family protein n=1 Tax=Dysgonomonas sp. 216 TaxID=2302934 RepID=UPI0013D6B2C4|nr:TolC family protein [Dysgonomonas sp. 216]NDW18794.1 TolC family protein [Dysgonomonas sp. 216]